jgi:hypothetical protein
MTEDESHSTKDKSNQPHLMNNRSLTELTVPCAVAGQWRKPTRQPHGLIPIRWYQSRKVKRMAIILVIMKAGLWTRYTKPPTPQFLNLQL